MQVYQVVDNSIVDSKVYMTKEGVALRLLEIVMNAKEGTMLNELLSIELLEVK
jgi:hypothetical protein